MLNQVTNHLWQSTLFAILAGLLTLAFRQNRAEIRYWLWFSASLKFFVPFSVLMGLGSRIPWTPVAKSVATPAVSFTVVQIAAPFPSFPSPAASMHGEIVDWLTLCIFGGWLCGFLAIAAMRTRDWLGIWAAVRSSVPISIPASVEVRSSPGLFEPGVVGLFRPILLLPEEIAGHLEPRQWQAVLAHELCHVRRRDNLRSAIHMIVEAVFWFHPVVWWIGARLVHERERACDEAVLRMGAERRDYAEAILNVCKRYAASPLSCVSGVTGSNLKERIQTILTGRMPDELNFAKKLGLGMAATITAALPIAAGVISAAHPRNQLQPGIAPSAATLVPKFETASIKPCEAFRNRKVPESPGRLESGCTTLQRLMQQAYGTYSNGQVNPLSSVTITGGPAWTDSALYEINAEAEDSEGQVLMKGPMLQALLEDRFQLKFHRESRNIPFYALSAAPGGPKMQPFTGTCVPWDYDHPNPGPEQCTQAKATRDGAEMKGWTVADLCYFLLVTLDRPVMDKTGIAGRFNFDLELSPEVAKDFGRVARGAPVRTDSAKPTADPSLVSGIKTWVNKIGLDLEPVTEPAEFIVIDSAEKPSEQ